MIPEAEGTEAQPHHFRDRPTVATDGDTCLLCGADLSSNGGASPCVCGHCLFDPSPESAEKDSCQADEERRPTAQNTTFLGPYMLLEEIGRGGQGVVYRALHRDTHEIAAVKTVLRQDAGSAESLMRFQREAASAQRLDHPHAMPVREVGCTAGGVPFFSMQLALGGSLYHLGAKYRGRWRQIAELLVKVAGAVHHAHEKGILHRDLKPGNILFTEEHEPLVTDFGLAKQLTGSNDLTQSCTVLGTPNYVSPEQAAGRTKELSPETDIYSLGAIMFELLTGRPPYVGDNPLDVLRQVATRPPTRPRALVRAVPKVLEAICLRCLERRPKDRYRSADEMADDLQRWLDGRKVTKVSWRERLRKVIWGQRSAFAFIWGIAALAAVIWVASVSVSHAPRSTNGKMSIAVAVDALDESVDLQAFAQQAQVKMQLGLSEAKWHLTQDGKAGKSVSSTGGFDPLSYGRAQGVQAVLAGCVRRAGEQGRLIIRLMRCDSGEVVWRHIYSVSLGHGGPSLSQVVVAATSDLQKWQQKHATDSGKVHYFPLPKAQTFYTRATELAARTNKADLQAAVELFRQAADLDPLYAEARAMLSFALWVQVDTYGEMEKLPAAISEARSALALDPESAQAHRVIASCYYKENCCNAALREFWTALELDPQSAGCCQSLGICLREMGHPHQAIAWLDRAVQLDRVHGAPSATLGESLALCGYDEQAEAALTHAVAVDGERPDFRIVLCALKTWQKDFGEARRQCEQARRRFPNNRFGLDLAAWIELCDHNSAQASLYFAELRAENSYVQNWEFYGAVNPSSALAYLAKTSGSPAQAQALAAEALKIDDDLLRRYPKNPRILHDLAATYAVIGQTERALSLLEDSVTAGWAEYRSTEIDPRFASIASLPRFKQILGRTLPDAL